MQWHKRPALQLVVISLVMVGVLSLQQGFAHNVLNVWGGGDYAQVALGNNSPLEQVNELVNVQAQNCADMDVPIDWTYGVNQDEKNNMLNRFPFSEEPWTYDMFGVYKNGRKYTEIPLTGSALTEATGYRDLGGDANVNNLLGSMFGYNPNRFLGAFKMKYPDGMGVAPEYIHGDFYGLNMPTVRNGCIRGPNPRNAGGGPGYEIAPGFVAMVVYADANSITLHIGRHEYQNVAFANGMTCTRGCTGGYWIYLTGVRPKGNILAAYNSVKNDQQNAKADKNPIKLPMVRPGQSIAEAVGDSVKLVVIDNGPIIAPNASKFWKEPKKDFGAPAVPPTTAPTQQPTQQPTPQTSDGPTQQPSPDISPQPTVPPDLTESPTPHVAIRIPPNCNDEVVCRDLRTSDITLLKWKRHGQESMEESSTGFGTTSRPSGWTVRRFDVINTPDIFPDINEVSEMHFYNRNQPLLSIFR